MFFSDWGSSQQEADSERRRTLMFQLMFKVFQEWLFYDGLTSEWWIHFNINLPRLPPRQFIISCISQNALWQTPARGLDVLSSAAGVSCAGWWRNTSSGLEQARTSHMSSDVLESVIKWCLCPAPVGVDRIRCLISLWPSSHVHLMKFKMRSMNILIPAGHMWLWHSAWSEYCQPKNRSYLFIIWLYLLTLNLYVSLFCRHFVRLSFRSIRRSVLSALGLSWRFDSSLWTWLDGPRWAKLLACLNMAKHNFPPLRQAGLQP